MVFAIGIPVEVANVMADGASGAGFVENAVWCVAEVWTCVLNVKSLRASV